MKYKILITFLCSFFVGLLCFKICFNTDENMQKIAHIYIDPATTSTVFQMIDLVQQQKSDPKYIAWRRFSGPLNKSFLNKHNIHRSQVQKYTRNEFFYQLIKIEASNFYKKNKECKFIIHINLHWSIRHFELLKQIIPKDKIKKVYLYDDSVGRTLWDNWNKKYDDFANEYPIVFKLSYKNEVLKKNPHLNKYSIDEVNFDTLINKLSNKDKNTLYQLINFKLDEVRSIIKNNDFIGFIDDPNISTVTTSNFINKLLEDRPELKNMLWIYKQHPRSAKPGIAYKLLKEKINNVYSLDPTIPFEILMVSGFNPKYVIGYGSSVFFSLKKEQVLGYIERKRENSRNNDDIYLPVLKELNILDDSNIVLVPNKK